MNDSERESLMNTIKNLQLEMKGLQSNIKDLQKQIDFLRSSFDEKMSDKNSRPGTKTPSKRWLIVFLYTLPFIALTCGYFLYFNYFYKNKIPQPKSLENIIQHSLNNLNNPNSYIQ